MESRHATQRRLALLPSHTASLTRTTTCPPREIHPPAPSNCPSSHCYRRHRSIRPHTVVSIAAMALNTKTTVHQRSTQSSVAMLPAGLRSSSCLRAVKSRFSNAPTLSARQQRRLVAARAAAEEKGKRCCLWLVVVRQCHMPGQAGNLGYVL